MITLLEMTDLINDISHRRDNKYILNISFADKSVLSIPSDDIDLSHPIGQLMSFDQMDAYHSHEFLNYDKAAYTVVAECHMSVNVEIITPPVSNNAEAENMVHQYLSGLHISGQSLYCHDSGITATLDRGTLSVETITSIRRHKQ